MHLTVHLDMHLTVHLDMHRSPRTS